MSNVFNFPQKGLGLATGALPLTSGAKGFAVAELQEALNKLGHKLTADGIFGVDTEQAVKTFQTKVGFGTRSNVHPADGIVDKTTWDEITNAVATGIRFDAGAQIIKFPSPASTSVIGSTPGGRPLWQWGLLALGVVGGIALLLKLMSGGEKGGVSGLRKLLSDEEKTIGGGTTEKCARTPSDDKLVDAEILEPS